MISTLEGNLDESGPLSAILNVGGVGYEVQIPLTTAERMPPPGNPVKLFTQAVYREDSATLYGFASREDRDFFRLLTEKVSGIGPKIALNILSRMSVPVLKQAISDGDVALLSKCPGIGKKTAERLIIELRDKVFSESVTAPAASGLSDNETGNPPGTASSFQDAVAALIALGYKAADADKSIRKAQMKIGSDAPTESLIKAALNS